MKNEGQGTREVAKERDETTYEADSFRFTPTQTVRLPRDQKTQVIVYGPPYRARARYDVVVRWPGHQRLTFRGIGDGDVQESDFDPVDQTPTGNVAPVYVTVSKPGGGEPQLEGFVNSVGGSVKIVTFYDFEITRDNVVTLFMVSYAD